MCDSGGVGISRGSWSRRSGDEAQWWSVEYSVDQGVARRHSLISQGPPIHHPETYQSERRDLTVGSVFAADFLRKIYRAFGFIGIHISMYAEPFLMISGVVRKLTIRAF